MVFGRVVSFGIPTGFRDTSPDCTLNSFLLAELQFPCRLELRDTRPYCSFNESIFLGITTRCSRNRSVYCVLELGIFIPLASGQGERMRAGSVWLLPIGQLVEIGFRGILIALSFASHNLFVIPRFFPRSLPFAKFFFSLLHTLVERHDFLFAIF